MAGSVTDTDKGFKALVDRILKGSGGLVLTVGVHAKEGGEPDGEGPLTVAEVGSIQEFGDGHVPPRSFVRAWADENATANQAAIKDIAKAVFEGKIGAAQALERLGLRMVGGMQARMAGGIPPPNAQSTIDKKGSSTPLIDKGILRSSIRSKVGPPSGEGG